MRGLMWWLLFLYCCVLWFCIVIGVLEPFFQPHRYGNCMGWDCAGRTSDALLDE